MLFAIIVPVTSLHYVMKILLDLIKDFDLVRRNQAMAIFNEYNSVETAGLVATLFQPSTVPTLRDEAKLSKVINNGLTQGFPASSALYHKTANILI